MMRALCPALMALSLVIAGCAADDKKSGPPEGLEEGNRIINLEFEDIDGNVETLHGLNNVTYIEIGTGWCPPCQAETPSMQTVYEEYQDQGFRVVQALFEDSNGANPGIAFMHGWQDQYGVTFTLVADVSEDFWQTLVPPSNTGYIPHNIILDKDGVITYTDYGGMSLSAMRNKIGALYGE